MFEEIDEPERGYGSNKPTDWSGTIVGLALAPVYFFFYAIDRADMGLSVVIFLGNIAIVTKFSWKLKAHIWFWPTIATIFLLHMPLVRLVTFRHVIVNHITLLPIGLADFLVILAFVKIAEKVFIRDSSDR